MNTGYDKASFDERMTLVQAAEACRFRPGDLVTHAACAPGSVASIRVDAATLIWA